MVDLSTGRRSRFPLPPEKGEKEKRKREKREFYRQRGGAAFYRGHRLTRFLTRSSVSTVTPFASDRKEERGREGEKDKKGRKRRGR